MGKDRFAPNTQRFAGLPRSPCVYAAELHQPNRLLLKVGVGSNAVGRMMSLQSEVKREHGADLGRIAVFSMPTIKGAYEAETRVIKALSELGSPIEGRREFFSGLSFESVCDVVTSTMHARVCALAEPKAETGA